MTMSNEMGVCSYWRYKGGKVTSMSSMTFAVHHASLEQCPTAKSINGFYFDADKPALSQPIVITANTEQEMKIGLRNSERQIVSQPSFTNEGPGFTLHWAVDSFQPGDKSVTIHDATGMIIKNVGGTVLGAMPLSGIATTINDVGGIANEISDRSGLTAKLNRKIDQLRGKKPKTKLVRIVIYPFRVPNSEDLGVTRITMKDLARVIWPI